MRLRYELRDCDGRVSELRCSFHGFCWNLDGSLKQVPCEWDFPQIDPASWQLPEVRVGPECRSTRAAYRAGDQAKPEERGPGGGPAQGQAFRLVER